MKDSTQIMANLVDLPDGWASTTLDDFVLVNPPKPDVSTHPDDTVVTFVPMSAVSELNGSIVSPQERKLIEVKRGYTAFREKDVLFAKITPCMENGKAAIAGKLSNGLGYGSTEFHVLRPLCGVPPDFIHHFVRQPIFRDEARRSMTGTAGQLRVPEGFVKRTPIAVPPLPEQHRIVEKLEKLLDRIRCADASIERVPVLLKQFRQAVLAAACSGKLVEQDSDDEPASALLERIRVERRKQWEVNLIAKGKDPQNHSYIEPAEPNTVNLSELPNGWTWTNFGMLAKVSSGYAFKAKEFSDIGVPVVRISNLIDERVEINGCVRIDPKYLQLASQFVLKEGDVLIAMSGATTGKTAIFDLEEKVLLNQRVGKFFVTSDTNVSRRFLWYLIERIKSQIIEMAWGCAQPNISGSEIETIVIPLPPLPEQRRIIKRVNDLFNIADTIEVEVVKAKVNSANIVQSILAKAFRGELVEQDPRDEPASKLLDMILARKDRKVGEKFATTKRRPAKVGGP
ncbi:MAG: restriction endonuclease subunit S [Bacteroidota bacterium]